MDQSGGTMARPAFQQAYERVLRKETGGLVVAKLDRFARSAADAGQVVAKILDAGGVFASAAGISVLGPKQVEGIGKPLEKRSAH